MGVDADFFTCLTEKTFHVVIRVEHDEDLSCIRAEAAVLLALESIEQKLFPVFAIGRNEEKYRIGLVDMEIF